MLLEERELTGGGGADVIHCVSNTRDVYTFIVILAVWL